MTTPHLLPSENRVMDRNCPICNLCGGTDFIDMNGRPKVRCRTCGSVERTRIMQLFLGKFKLVRPGIRVMHLAPELGMSRRLIEAGVIYDAYDLQPDLYRHTNVNKLDLAECEALPSRRYDLIIHSHVMEHVPCNVTAVLYHLHRALKDDGTHLFAVPIYVGAYREDLGQLDRAERVRRFHQIDHVRRFGRDDILKTIGMVFRIEPRYDLVEHFSAEQLRNVNIPEALWYGYDSSSIFCLKKCDLKLTGAG